MEGVSNSENVEKVLAVGDCCAGGNANNIELSNVHEKICHAELFPLSCSSADEISGSTSSCGDDEDVSKDDLQQSSFCNNFMKEHVSKLFNPNVDILVTNKYTFGELCQTSEGRIQFAKFVDKHRSKSQLVEESTFYKLAHSFALVLFECAENDDFIPAKTLMNMAFTYYHIPEGTSWPNTNGSTAIMELASPDMSEYTMHLSEGETDCIIAQKEKQKSFKKSRKGPCKTENKKNFWRSAEEFFQKDIPLFKESFEKKRTVNHKESSNCNNTHSCTKETIHDQSPRRKLSLSLKTKKKVFLYQALQNQLIWKSLRFWNAAFFNAVQSEQEKHRKILQWSSLTQEERDGANESLRNVTFGQLGTFINNMKHLGIGKDTCLQFLRKQSFIGNLNKELYQLLKCQIDLPIVDNVL
ncbi:uncharacterized protein KIAA0513-like [Clavelina lepadiformis]|uniref:uncharacterized protein KIAA0513-like n=1 Tax=Clavelina lepadiformis TaxID=159417 RepID=UPI00404241CA